MEEKKNRLKKMNTGNYYVQGSAAHQPEIVAPNPQREKKRQATEETLYRHHLAVEKEQLREFSNKYVIGFVTVVGLSLALLGNYVAEEAALHSQGSQIQTLQKTWNQLKTVNDATEAGIEDSIDLSIIEQSAMQFGMIYPDASQVREFEKTEGDYIRKYENIPE